MVNVYWCGGAASNISKSVKDLDVNSFCIDTSVSNLKGIDDSTVYLVQDIDGAGKLRSKSYESFNGLEEEVLVKFKPSKDLNIVVSSLSGGSGAIISSIVAKKLITEGFNTIIIGIDSKHSIIEIENSIKTLKSYKGISDTSKKSVTVYYVENTSRKEADQQVIRFINLMSLLTNKALTEEFDTTDLHHFINPEKVTDNKPTVGIIDISANEEIVPAKNTTIVSTILLTSSHESTISEIKPEYLATCIVTDKNYKNEDIRIDNIYGSLGIIIDGLEKEVTVLKDNKRINKHKDIEVTGATNEGIIL